MKVLIIGSGGREHAVAEAFSKSRVVETIYVSPGNAGIAREYPTLELPSFDIIVDFCNKESIDLVFIGPEIPIQQGLSDILVASGIAVFGPSQRAGRIESSKVYAKQLMQRAGIPSAAFISVSSFDEACMTADRFGYPLVIKADGLAAGKGVTIVNNHDEACAVFESLLVQKTLGEAGAELVLEEYLQGWEVSLFAITDGIHFQTMLFSQDHKQLHDNDIGPNTGGMGAYAPVPDAEKYRKIIEDRIIAPTLRALKDEGSLYRGALYCGLMITKEGPKVIEYNCRFGDPETQVVLPLLKTDFMDICRAVVNGSVDQLQLSWKPDTAVCVVLASEGYPGKYETGHKIEVSAIGSSRLFYAGVGSEEECLVTKGGRVLNVIGVAESLKEARAIAYEAVEQVHFTGKTFRSDIGLRINDLFEDFNHED